MAFTGKATYFAGATLPEIAEDVADLVSLVSPYETPLLDLLGDATRVARSTVHEWMEDSLWPNSAVISDTTLSNPDSTAQFDVDAADPFRIGDQIRMDGSAEVMLVTAITSNTLTVVRGYGQSDPAALVNGAVVRVIGNAALEGGDAPTPRFTARSRKKNYTQIFTSTVEVSGSELAVSQIAVDDELDYQKTLRLRELLRDLENTVVNGRAAAENSIGGPAVRRTMNGLLSSISTVFNVGAQGTSGFTGYTALTEDCLNLALRRIWETSSGRVDTIIVNGKQKRAINGFISASVRSYSGRSDTVLDRVAVYESDFGTCDVVLSRYVPNDTAILIDRSRVSVMPLAGRSFAYVPLATTGDRRAGQVIGEYTMEVRNAAAHGVIRKLA